MHTDHRVATLARQHDQYGPTINAPLARYRAVNREYLTASRAPDYRTVVTARIRHMADFYSQPFSYLPMGPLTLFLIGLLGLRLGLFDEPQRHRRLIVGCMIFGVMSWAAAEWLFPMSITRAPTTPLPIRVIINQARANAFNLLRGNWLAFTYIGSILLLVAHNPAWLRRLSAFGIAGRMALTNYMLQVMILDFTFSNYAFGASIGAGYAPLAALGLFGVEVMFSRWWLARFRYGPMEWLWRSITYARWQPLGDTSMADRG